MLVKKPTIIYIQFYFNLFEWDRLLYFKVRDERLPVFIKCFS